MKTERVLVALLAGRPIGQVEIDRHGRLSFTYDEDWHRVAFAVPLSLSLPLSSRSHPHEPVDAFLWGLLPDNEAILDRWGRRFHVSPRNPFALLRHVGEDCAGAVQFVTPDRAPRYTSSGPLEVEWLDEAAVARRLAALRTDPSAWRGPSDSGQFSLAGAQAKTALLLEAGRWGVPSGRTPTTHILKPPIAGLPGHVENEHLCLQLARALGLPAASSQVQRFDGEVAIVVERFDRARTADLAAAAAAEAATAAAQAALATSAREAADAAKRAANAAARSTSLDRLAQVQPILRLHQEDLCQALAVKPTSKYENEGGPGTIAVVSLLREHSSASSDDVQTFVDSLVLNWLIAGTDGHAKNYGLLHGGGGRVRLAPLYDVASALPYPELDLRRLKLAMKVGGKYRVHEIGAREWRKMAVALSLGEERLVSRARDLASRIPDVIATLRKNARRDGLVDPVVDRLAREVASRARHCAKAI